MKCLKRTMFVVGCALANSCFAAAQQTTSEKPKFGEFRCRADAQKWTATDLTDKQRAAKVVSLGVVVNGQIRILPMTSLGVTVRELRDRASEMGICESEDSEFQKQFNTYALIERQYREEVTSRYVYFLLNHNLLEQFAKEDATSFE